jgi:hypothetical protein
MEREREKSEREGARGREREAGSERQGARGRERETRTHGKAQSRGAVTCAARFFAAQAMRHAGQANEVCGVCAGTCAEKGSFPVTLRPTTISSRSLPLSAPLSRTPKRVVRGLRGAECIYVPTGMLLIDRALTLCQN